MSYKYGPETEAERAVNDRVVAVILDQLTERGLVPEGDPFDARAFRDVQERVESCFRVEQSSITTLMARVLFAIAGRIAPSSVLALGSYQGNSLVWLAGPLAKGRVVGMDVNPQATMLARRNLEAIGLDNVELFCRDGHTALEVVPGPLDLILLDAETVSGGKELYATLLAAIEPELRAGSLVLAHDACVARFQPDLTSYFEAVRDRHRFRASLTLAIDDFGLEVSMR